LTILIVLLTGSLLGDNFSSRSLADERPISADDNGISADDDSGLFLLPRIAESPPFNPLRAASLVELDAEDVVPVESGESEWKATRAKSQAEADPAGWREHRTAPAIDGFFDPPSGSRNTDEVTADLELGEEFDIVCEDCQWTWQTLPDGLMYKSYLAGTRESRISAALLYDTKEGWLFDATLGGRVGILRYGTAGASGAEGWQLDVEGAAFVRLNVERQWDVDSVDFRFGVPLTYRRGPWQWKTGYYHLSSHVGDEFLVRHPGFRRINYVRDSLFFGLGYYLTDDVRLYSEVGLALKTIGGAEPLELQFGADYSPAYDFGLRGAPYMAFNVHLREEVDFGGGVNLMAGWQWRGPTSASIVRAGLQYYNGKTTQYAFFRQHEELIGFGLWYDY
jgi:hypothetical protein